MRLAAPALALLLALPAYPQQKLIESIEVRVANIDVVVRDKAGNPVSGLTREDFELFEDGVRQPITNIYEVRRSEAGGTEEQQADVPLAVRQRRILFFFDSSSIPLSRKASVIASLQRFIDERMRPEDQAMIVSWRLGLDVITPFTADRQELRRGLEQLDRVAPASESTLVVKLKHDIDWQRNLAESGSIAWQEAYEESVRLAESHAAAMAMQQEKTVDAIDRMLATVAGFEGKKVLLLVSEHFARHPGAEMFRYVSDLFLSHMRTVNPLDMQATTGVVGNRMDQHIDDLARRASSDGVTIYAIGTGQTDSEFGADNDLTVDSSEAYSRVANTASALQSMAEATGGVAVNHTSNFDLAFDTIRRDLDSYYSIGYRPAEGKTTARKIVVKAKNRAYSARARESFILKSTDQQMDERIIANLYADAAQNEWPITVKTGTPRLDSGKYLVPVQVIMPYTITLLPQDDSLIGGFILYFAVGTARAQTSEIMRRPQGLKIPPAAEKAIRAKPMTYSTAIRVNAGESVLSVAILDQISGTMGFARAKIVAH